MTGVTGASTSAASTVAISPPDSHWDPAVAQGLSALDGLVYRSNLLGSDRTIANQGGGNTSAKERYVDHAGREGMVLWIKGSGTDLATITTTGFAGLRLDELALLRSRDAMTDEEMVSYLLRCAIRPDQPRPSIETLLHAFIPALHVDHTHPDTVIALTSSPRGCELAAEHFRGEVIWLGYERPGFAMSKRVALLLDENPSVRAVFLEKHGLVTWGATGEESYRTTIEFVSRCAELIAEETASFRVWESNRQALDAESATDLLFQAMPILRGEIQRDQTSGVILEADRGDESVAFASAERTPAVSQGSPCPDHLINTKHKPLIVDFDPQNEGIDVLTERIRAGSAEYASWYRSYYEQNVDAETKCFPMDPPGPRVILIPGLGILTAGSDARKARLTRDLFHRAISVQRAADGLGGFRSLAEDEAFAVEYWPLERYKLAQEAPPGELAGQVAVVTGAASGIGRAAARLLAERGAHVVIADLNAQGAEEAASELEGQYGERTAIGVRVDVTDEEAVCEMVRRTVLTYGGIDILVASAGLATSASLTETSLSDWERNFAVLARGYFLVAREVFRVLERQDTGGSIVFVASKNALVAGANAAAYSSAKAASLHLARCLAEEGGPYSIRVNTVNPDAVIEGSAIWSSDWRDERAATYGIESVDLQAFYKSRTKLGVAVLPDDVAEAIAYFAGPRSAKSTGNILNVDGGVTAAYPR